MDPTEYPLGLRKGWGDFQNLRYYGDMLTLVAALCFPAQAPKSFKELEAAKISSVSGIAHFYCRTQLMNVGQAEHENVSVQASKDKISYQSYDEEQNQVGYGGSTGEINWIMTPQDRFALTTGGISTNKLSSLESVITSQELMLSFSKGQQVAFSSVPGFDLKEITSVTEDGQTVRKAVATAELTRGTVTLTQWFMADKWILRHFSIELKEKDKTFSCSGRVSNLAY